MRFFSTNVLLPVGVYDMSVTTEEPRIPTAFEWQVVKIVEGLLRAGVHTDVTVLDIFRSVLGCDGIESFVLAALQSLFSSTVGVLRTTNHRVELENLHISEIILTDEGRRLLRSKKLPSAPKTVAREVYFDFARNAIVPQGRRGMRSDSDSSNKLPQSLVEGIAAPIEQQRAIEERQLARGVRIRDVSCVVNNARQYYWRVQNVSFSIENNRIVLDPVTSAPNDNTDRYLRSLTPEIAQRLFFEREFSAVGVMVPSTTVDLPSMELVSICPASQMNTGVVRSAPITVRLEDAQLGGWNATLLDVVLKPASSGAPEIEMSKDSGGFRMVLHGNAFGLQNGCVTDCKTVKTYTRVRCYYDGLPLELPVFLEYKLDSTVCQSLSQAIETALSRVPAKERYAIGYLRAPTDSDRSHLLAQVRANEGAKAAEIVNFILDVLARRKTVQDGRVALLKELFAAFKLKTIGEIGEAFDFFNAVNVLSSERRPWVGKMLEGLAVIPLPTLRCWVEFARLNHRLGGNWSFSESGPLCKMLSRPDVSTEECEFVWKTITEISGRDRWLDVCRGVLRNRGVRLSPLEYEKRAKTLAHGDEGVLKQNMSWFMDFANWKSGFADEKEMQEFFLKYELPLPKQNPAKKQIQVAHQVDGRRGFPKEEVHLVPKASLIIIDGSNLVSHDESLRTLSLKAVLDALTREGYKYQVFFDKSIFSWLRDKGDLAGIEYLNAGVADGHFTIAPSRAEADGQILQLADTESGVPHVISLDNYRDRAKIYPWVLGRNAQSRVHGWNFVKSQNGGIRILLADFRLDIVIPHERLSSMEKGDNK